MTVYSRFYVTDAGVMICGRQFNYITRWHATFRSTASLTAKNKTEAAQQIYYGLPEKSDIPWLKKNKNLN